MEIIHQQVQRKKEKMARLADLQRRSTKPPKKYVILFKTNKIEGPNTGSFIKKACSTTMDGMMILIMIPLLLMMLLLGSRTTCYPMAPIIQATSASHV
jgi:hypothetical protein